MSSIFMSEVQAAASNSECGLSLPELYIRQKRG